MKNFFLSFYHNVVCKNIVCELGLSVGVAVERQQSVATLILRVLEELTL